MLIGEPPQTQYDVRFHLFGIPVRIHPFFWLVAVILGYQPKTEPIYLLIWVLCVFASILIHELGHALAALAYGWRPWITLYGFGGLASYQPTRHDARSQIAISAAGPGIGFLFIAFVMAAVHATGHSVQLIPDNLKPGYIPLFPPWAAFRAFESDNVNILIFCLWQINILWGLINLLPVYPLDGGQIAREMCVSANPSGGIVQSLWISIFTGGAIAVASLFFYHRLFLAVMFGYLAYMSYTTLQQYTGRGGGFGGPWGGSGGSGGRRGW